MSREEDLEKVLEGAVKLLTKTELKLMMRLYKGGGNLCDYPLTYKKLYDYYTLAAELGYYDKRKNPENPVPWIMNNFKELLIPGSKKEIRRLTDLYLYKRYDKKGLPRPFMEKRG